MRSIKHIKEKFYFSEKEVETLKADLARDGKSLAWLAREMDISYQSLYTKLYPKKMNSKTAFTAVEIEQLKQLGYVER